MADSSENNIFADQENTDGEKKKKNEEKKEEVKKVSPVARFFSSMKVKFSFIILVYSLLSVLVGCLGALLACIDLYEKMDVLDMKERVQNAVGGLQRSSLVMIQRGGLAAKQFHRAFANDFSYLNDSERTERVLARHIHDKMSSTVDGPGAFDYKQVPMHLIMFWDQDWNEKLVYYRPCKDVNNRERCELVSREYPFKDYAGGDYSIIHKEEVPKIFRNIKDIKPTKCTLYGDCLGIADIPNEEGGPMLYFLAEIPGTLPVIPRPLVGWHMLWGCNMLFVNEIQSNRTGLCVAGYSSNEKDLPQNEVKEIQKKKDKGLLLNPFDAFYNNTNWIGTIFQDTDVVTLAQDFYSRSHSHYVKSDRSYCDNSYDHGTDHQRTMSTVYFAYRGFDFVKGNLSDDIYLQRFDYHNPIAQRSFSPMHTAVVSTSIAWFVTVCILVIYFNCSFLVPLEKMRKMRSDFIKTSLAGLDDDGTLAKEIFGDMVDDNALIDANGDEIRVMLTLQDRLDEFYNGLIKTRSNELAHIKAYYQRRLNAQRTMNYFMRREDEDLHIVLPGLLDSKEVNRHFRRNAITGGDKGDFLQNLLNARHSFRQFKTILSNELAIEFFKAFCAQRGRSTVNSLFFMMDVSWLHQCEDTSRKGNDDFLSNLFSDSMSPGSNSNLGSPRMTSSRPDNLLISSTKSFSIGDAEPGTPRGAENRPHRSHFAKSKQADHGKNTSESSASASTTDVGKAAIAADLPEDDDNKKKVKVPFINVRSLENNRQSSSLSSLPSPSGSGADLPKLADGPAFTSNNGDAIAHFIYDSYFGHKSLAQRDLKHSALLGCSQVPDYIALRDNSDNLTFSPIMYNNLLEAVVKKFQSDVIPQFMESPTFQVMVYCLMLTNYFNKGGKNRRQRAIDDEVIEKKSSAIIEGVWSACYVPKKDEDDDETSSSSSSSDEEDDKEKEGEEPKSPVSPTSPKGSK